MRSVMMASHRSTKPGVTNMRMMMSQMYAKMQKTAVTANTLMFLMRRTSGFGIAKTQTPVITSKLNAAEPTIVLGPRAPALNLLPKISIQDRRISGEDDPNAIRVRFATVSFQTFTSISS